jgi:hypothetical protein
MNHPLPIGSVVRIKNQDGLWTITEATAFAKDVRYRVEKPDPQDGPWKRYEWAREITLVNREGG